MKKFKEIALKSEENALFRKGAFSKDHLRYIAEEADHRLPYKRDVDRIVHSKAYCRYIDKTQVVHLADSDHITKRSLHVQLVSNFSRGIAEILRLNLDLVEAISLGHDVGHPPFGHEGEEYLSLLSEEYGRGKFAHSAQSCRLLMEIEPLNLGFAVYDGFLCHDGGLSTSCLKPAGQKSWKQHFKERLEKFHDPEKNIFPATLEGCLVKLCDTISYLGKDIEDAINLGIITRSQVPRTVLGTTNGEILSYLAKDIIEQSFEKNTISLSEESFEAIKQLRKFNFSAIYFHPSLKTESEKIKRSYRFLFESLLNDFEKKEKNSHLWRSFLHNKSEKYLESTDTVTSIIDYIAGMTNNYFNKCVNQFL